MQRTQILQLNHAISQLEHAFVTDANSPRSFFFLDFDQKLTLFRVGSVGSDVVVVVVVFVVGSIDPQQRGNDGQKDERETK